MTKAKRDKIIKKIISLLRTNPGEAKRYVSSLSKAEIAEVRPALVRNKKVIQAWKDGRLEGN